MACPTKATTGHKNRWPVLQNLTTGHKRRWPVLQSLQVGDEIVFFLVAEHVFVGGHTVATVIDASADIGFGGLLAVGELVLLEEAFQSGPHFLFVAIRIVTDGALFENCLALLGIAFAARERSHRAGSQNQTKKADVKSFVSQNRFLPGSDFSSYNQLAARCGLASTRVPKRAPTGVSALQAGKPAPRDVLRGGRRN